MAMNVKFSAIKLKTSQNRVLNFPQWCLPETCSSYISFTMVTLSLKLWHILPTNFNVIQSSVIPTFLKDYSLKLCFPRLTIEMFLLKQLLAEDMVDQSLWCSKKVRNKPRSSNSCNWGIKSNIIRRDWCQMFSSHLVLYLIATAFSWGIECM